MEAKITHVAVAVNTCHGVSYARILHEDGRRAEAWGEGVAALGEVLALSGIDGTVVVISHSKLVSSEQLRAVFPNVTICAPYDEWTMGLYLAAREAPNRVYERVPALQIGTDASVLKGRAGAWAWVASEDGATDFRTGRANPELGTVKIETHAILRALATRLSDDHRPVVIYSDCRAAIRTVERILTGEQPWPVWAGPDVEHRLRRYLSRDLLHLEWVKGHAGHPLNVVADQLARHSAHCQSRGITKSVAEAEEKTQARNLIASLAS